MSTEEGGPSLFGPVTRAGTIKTFQDSEGFHEFLYGREDMGPVEFSALFFISAMRYALTVSCNAHLSWGGPMRFQLLRHATSVISLKGLNLLLDPMLSPKGTMGPIANAANQNRFPLSRNCP